MHSKTIIRVMVACLVCLSLAGKKGRAVDPSGHLRKPGGRVSFSMASTVPAGTGTHQPLTVIVHCRA